MALEILKFLSGNLEIVEQNVTLDNYNKKQIDFDFYKRNSIFRSHLIQISRLSNVLIQYILAKIQI